MTTAPPQPLADARSAAWSALVALLLLMPVGRLPAGSSLPWLLDLAADKVTHAALFYVTARLYLRSAAAAGWNRPSVVAALAAIAFGGLLEVAQSFVGRDAEWADLIADALGAVLALAPFARLRRPARDRTRRGG